MKTSFHRTNIGIMDLYFLMFAQAHYMSLSIKEVNNFTGKKTQNKRNKILPVEVKNPPPHLQNKKCIPHENHDTVSKGKEYEIEGRFN